MSKKSRRRNKILAAGAALLGASKMGLLGGKTAAGLTGDKMASARKLMTSDVAMRGKTPSLPIAKVEITKKIPGIKVDKDVISSGPFKMFGASNKTAGGKKFSAESIEKFKAANRAQEERRAKLKMGKSDRTDVPGFFGMKFDKPLFNKGKMVKARGGGMARTKPTKLS
jgi:hypothetical protein